LFFYKLQIVHSEFQIYINTTVYRQEKETIELILNRRQLIKEASNLSVKNYNCFYIYCYRQNYIFQTTKQLKRLICLYNY